MADPRHTKNGRSSADPKKSMKPDLGKFAKVATAIAITLGAVAAAIAIYTFVRPSGLPSFSGDMASRETAADFISFLGQHVTERVKLNITCNAPPSSAACYLSYGDKSADFIILSSDPVHSASACWNSSITCKGLAVIILVNDAENTSGEWYEPNGPGTATIIGNWRIQDAGVGVIGPPDDPAYGLTPTN